MILRAAIALSLIHFSFLIAMDKDRDKIEIQITSSVPQSKLVFLDLGLDLSQIESINPYLYETDQIKVEAYSAYMKNGEVICCTYFHQGPFAGKFQATKFSDCHKQQLRLNVQAFFHKLKSLHTQQLIKNQQAHS